MRWLAVVLICSGLGTHGQAQNWQPFNFNRSYYVSKSHVKTEEPTISFRDGEVISVLLSDSSSDSNGIHLIPKTAIGCDIRDFNSECHNQMESCTGSFSWIGSTLTLNENNWTTRNRNGYVINLPNAKDSEQTLLIDNGVSYNLKLISKEARFVLNSHDTVVEFFLETIDSNGIDSLNIWYGDTLRLSAFHGLVNCPSWYLFPNTKTEFTLVDQNGYGLLRGISFNAMYNYRVGDIVQTQYYSESGYYNGWSQADSTLKIIKQCEVLSIDSSGVTNSFQLSCKKLNRVERFDNSNWGTSKLEYEGTKLTREVEIWNATNLKNEFYNVPLKWIYGVNWSMNQTWLKYSNLTHGFYGSVDCPIQQSIFEPWWSEHRDYLLGIGLVEDVYSYIEDYIGDYTIRTYNVTYFKSDSRIYGTPGWPLEVDEVSNSKISIYPNPFTVKVQISSTSRIEQISIQTITGQVLLSQFYYSNSTELNLFELESGVYLINIQDAEGWHTQKIVKL